MQKALRDTADAGTDPGTDSGTDSGTKSGTNPGTDTRTDARAKARTEARAGGARRAEEPRLLRRTAAGELRITARGAQALLECMRTRGRDGYVMEDLFYAVLLHPAKVLDGPDGLHLADSLGRRIAISRPAVLCGGKTLIVRGEAAGRELPDLVVTARDLAKAACPSRDSGGAGRD